MAASRTQNKRKKKPPARAKRSLLASRPSLRPMMALEPHHVDILALALLALGIFLGGVTYLHWAGGSLGHGAVTGLRFLVGELAYATPVALVISGVLLLARDLRPPGRPLRTGSLCLVGSLSLMLAAGALGIGPGQEPAGHFFTPHVVEARGGMLGAAEFWVTGHLLSTAGADILAVFGLLAAIILLSGATLASVVLAGRAHAAEAIRRSEMTLATRRVATHAGRAGLTLDPDDEPFLIPEPGTDEVVITATHVEAPAMDETDENEQLSFEPEEPPEYEPELEEPIDEAGVAAASQPEVNPEDLTPQGRYRASITDDPEFVWRLPSTRVLVRSTADQAKPDTAGQEQVARQLIEALGHFGA